MIVGIFVGINKFLIVDRMENQFCNRLMRCRPWHHQASIFEKTQIFRRKSAWLARKSAPKRFLPCLALPCLALPGATFPKAPVFTGGRPAFALGAS
jgi:hypothetical protein